MEEFDTIVKNSYDYKNNFIDPKWRLLRELYIKNYLNASDKHDRMPKKIHQIWLGGEMPKEYKVFCDSWKKFNPQWEYKLWTDKDLNDVIIPRRNLFNSITHLGQKSDFLRYHILNQFGGLYVDTDFECLKSFDSLRYAEFLTGVGYPSSVELYIGLIGCVPQNPILNNVISSMDRIESDKWRSVFETTGTYFFTRKFFEIVKEYTPNIVVLPTDYFYPLPNNRRGANKKEFIKEWSYAVHHWEMSWRKKK